MARNGVLSRILAALTVAAAMPLHAQESNVYAWVHIAPDPMDPGLVLPRQYQTAVHRQLQEHLSRRLSPMTVVAADAQPPETGRGVVLTWTVLKFTAGDPDVRQQIGLGFGTTRLEVTYRFLDARTGQVVLDGWADGKVIGGWGNGGDSLGAAEGLAKEVAARAGRKLPRHYK
jgi:hypothetical protein